jgi:hypothetical protein
LNKIRRYLFMAPGQPPKAIERLEEFCMDANSRQNDALNEISSGLQVFLLDSGNQAEREPFIS